MSYLKDHPINVDWFRIGVTNEMVLYSDNFAKHLVEEEKIPGTSSYVILPLTTSQLRKFFGVVKGLLLDVQVNGFNEAEIVMLKPKLAYAVGRVVQKNQKSKSRRIEDFSEVMTAAIDVVLSSKDRNLAFKNFISFFEAIVAYHKRYGKENLK